MKTIKSKKKMLIKNKKPIIASIVILTALFGIFLKNLLVQEVDINIIESATPITIEGTLFKDSPINSPGNYYISILTGAVIRLQTTEKLDSFEGAIVRIKGSVLPNQGVDGLDTILVQELELLSTQQNN